MFSKRNVDALPVTNLAQFTLWESAIEFQSHVLLQTKVKIYLFSSKFYSYSWQVFYCCFLAMVG